MNAMRTRTLATLIATTVGLPLGSMAASANAAKTRPSRGAMTSGSTASLPAERPTSNVMAAATVDSCYHHPTKANCDGAWVNRGDLCGRSSLSVSTTTYIDQGWTFVTDLRYSWSCSSYFSDTTVGGGPDPITGWDYVYSGKVRRNGPDGYLMQHGGWTWTDPVAWGPDVLSPLVYRGWLGTAGQACLSNQANDQAVCTPWTTTDL